MSIEDTLLSEINEINQTQKDKYYMILLLYELSRVVTSQNHDSRFPVKIMETES